MKRGGGVRKARVDPNVASSSELILALLDDLMTAAVGRVIKCKSLWLGIDGMAE